LSFTGKEHLEQTRN